MSSFPYTSSGGPVRAAWEFPTPRCTAVHFKLVSPPSSSQPASKLWLSRQTSSKVTTKMLCFTGLVFPHFLSLKDHFNLQRTSLACKKIVDVYRFHTYALPFKKNIETLENTAYVTEQFRSQAREALVRSFFRTPEILLLDPVPLTALFDSLHPETLKFQIYWEHQTSYMIKKIAVHFFSSQSTAPAVKERAKIYGQWTKDKWEAINKAPNDFFVKLSPVMINTIVFFILKAAKHPAAELMREFDQGCIHAIAVFCGWIHRIASPPNTLRPIDDYLEQFTQEKVQDFTSMQRGVLFGVPRAEKLRKISSEKPSDSKESTPMQMDTNT
jgi:hypothetical protein